VGAIIVDESYLGNKYIQIQVVVIMHLTLNRKYGYNAARQTDRQTRASE
jgi:hypothetical protein